MAQSKSRWTLGARWRNLKLLESSRAAILVLVTYKQSFSFNFTHIRESITFIHFFILNYY